MAVILEVPARCKIQEINIAKSSLKTLFPQDFRGDTAPFLPALVPGQWFSTKLYVQVPYYRKAHAIFQKNEPRDLFYRAATELIALARDHKSSLDLAEALAVLLQTWNRQYYRFRKFDGAHFENIEHLLQTYQSVLAEYLPRTIDCLAHADEATVTDLFKSFETVLGPVGAAKALHLIAPRFFPLWDDAIAKAHEESRSGATNSGQGRFPDIGFSSIGFQSRESLCAFTSWSAPNLAAISERILVMSSKNFFSISSVGR